MDNGYRFGRIEVTCEGYSHPSDPYILKGSCGLEYTLELTEEGRRRNHGSWSSQKSGGFEGRSKNSAQKVSTDSDDSCYPALSSGLGDTFSGFFSSLFGKTDHHYHQQSSHQSSSQSDDGDSGSLLVILVLLLFAFGIYKLFLSPNASHDGSNHDGHAGYHRDHRYGSNPGPPPAGFKPDYTGSTGSNSRPIVSGKDFVTMLRHLGSVAAVFSGSAGSNPDYGFHTDYTQDQQYPGGRAANNTGGGFWTGMGTGGLLGYMFGRQRLAQRSTHLSVRRVMFLIYRLWVMHVCASILLQKSTFWGLQPLWIPWQQCQLCYKIVHIIRNSDCFRYTWTNDTQQDGHSTVSILCQWSFFFFLSYQVLEGRREDKSRLSEIWNCWIASEDCWL